MATNIFTRGTTQWWRRSVHLAALINDPITIRISLKTRCPREGKTRAAYLETEIRNVGIEVQNALRTVVKPEDMRAIYKASFKAKLDEYIVRQAATSYRADAHAVTNLIYSRFFTLLASWPNMPEVHGELIDTFMGMGLSERDAENLFVTISQHRGRSPIGPGQVAKYLEGQGIAPNVANLQSMTPVIAAAYRNACVGATEAMGMENPRGILWPLPLALQHLLHLDPIEASAAIHPNIVRPRDEPASYVRSDRPVPVQAVINAIRPDGRKDALFSEAVSERIRNGGRSSFDMIPRGCDTNLGNHHVEPDRPCAS